MPDVTRLLVSIDGGDQQASAELLPLVYDELRSMAAKKLNNEPAGQTLQPTALVHEAYLRLVGSSKNQQWQGRRHFFAAAAESMRRILVDNARKKRSEKHGGHLRRELLPELAATSVGVSRDDVVAIHEALDKFSQLEPQKAELVKLRYFAGLTLPEVAELMGISRATASRHWTYARAWLFHEIFATDDDEFVNS